MKQPFRARLIRTPLAFFAMLSFAPMSAWADRVVLSPLADTLPPLSFKAEYAQGITDTNASFGWLQYATHQGIELEGQHYGRFRGIAERQSLNIQYPIVYDFGSVPAVSVGLRDVFRTGAEHRALYLAVSKTVPLSDRQTRLLREVKWNIGAGTERLNGAFVGLQFQLRTGLRASVEYYQNRPNISLGLPIARNLLGRAYSLNGRLFYGLSYSLIR